MNKLYYFLIFVFLAFLPADARFHYQEDFIAKDFQARRGAIYDAIGDNIAIIQRVEETEMSPRELSVSFTETQSYYISEASVYRILKAADKFQNPTTAVNQL